MAFNGSTRSRLVDRFRHLSTAFGATNGMGDSLSIHGDHVLQMTLSHFHIEKMAGREICATGLLVKGPIEKVYPKMYLYAYDDELFHPENGLTHAAGKVKMRAWNNKGEYTEKVKGEYWLTPENIPKNGSPVQRLQLITSAGPRNSEPKWKVALATDEVKSELYVPFGHNRHIDKLEPLTDNHPEVNPSGRSGGAAQYRTKNGANIVWLEDMETGIVYEGDALFNYLKQRFPDRNYE